MSEETPKWWYCTFGYGHNPGIGYYTKIWGTRLQVHEEMHRRYGNKWANLYESAEAAGVTEFNLQEV